MKRFTSIAALTCFLAIGWSYAQRGDDKTKPEQGINDRKEIKNVPSAEVKSKPAKISSAARPSGIRPSQPGNGNRPEGHGKPETAGKPINNGKPATAGRPANPGKPNMAGKPPGK
jgi:hypothetical protein